jgi:hypothetical protein
VFEVAEGIKELKNEGRMVDKRLEVKKRHGIFSFLNL